MKRQIFFCLVCLVLIILMPFNNLFAQRNIKALLSKEIVKVEDPDNIQKVLCTYWGEGERSPIRWTTVWEAPAKETPEQIKQRELMEKYEAVKKEFEELGKQIGVGQ